MVAVGDVLQITDVQNNGLTGKQFLNVYHYEVTETAGVLNWSVISTELAAEFVSEVITPIRAVQHASITHVGIRIRNMNSPYEEFESIFTVPLVGTATTEPAPSFVTLSYKYIRQTSSTRSDGSRSVALERDIPMARMV